MRKRWAYARVIGCHSDKAQALLSAPDISTLRGLRDRAILAVLLGCGLRRSEVAALTFAHLQHRDGRWCIVDLMGKHGGIRTMPMPTWVKLAIDAWTTLASIADGFAELGRPVHRTPEARAQLKRAPVWDAGLWGFATGRRLCDRGAFLQVNGPTGDANLDVRPGL